MSPTGWAGRGGGGEVWTAAGAWWGPEEQRGPRCKVTLLCSQLSLWLPPLLQAQPQVARVAESPVPGSGGTARLEPLTREAQRPCALDTGLVAVM